MSTAGYLYNDGAWPWTKQLRGCLLHCAPIIHFLPKGPPPDTDRLIQAISLISSRSFLGPFPRLIGLRNVFLGRVRTGRASHAPCIPTPLSNKRTTKQMNSLYYMTSRLEHVLICPRHIFTCSFFIFIILLLLFFPLLFFLLFLGGLFLCLYSDLVFFLSFGSCFRT